MRKLHFNLPGAFTACFSGVKKILIVLTQKIVCQRFARYSSILLSLNGHVEWLHFTASIIVRLGLYDWVLSSNIRIKVMDIAYRCKPSYNLDNLKSSCVPFLSLPLSSLYINGREGNKVTEGYSGRKLVL